MIIHCKKISAFILIFGIFISNILIASDYQYDASGRLLSADYGNGKVITYEYDNASNIIKVEVTDTLPPLISLNGDSTVNIEAGTTYIDPGAQAQDLVDGALAVDSESSIDTLTVGTYIVIYTSIDAAGNTATATRTVLVEDTTAPEVALNGSADITLEAGIEGYVEQNISATDTITAPASLTVTIDGNVDTSSVGSYVVTYTVTDLQNNSVQLTRVITVQDTTPPTLELLGSPTITIEAGTNYTEEGAVATDIVDGTVSVTIDSSVDTSVVGTYIVTYTTDDAAGNLVTATRTVLVEDTTAPEVALNGSADITLEAGVESYEEQSISATDTITALSSLTVTIDGNVDTSSVGTYLVTYTVTDLQNNSVQLTRVITVQDTTPPTLELLGSPTITVEAGTNYTDEGAVATDIVDGTVSVTIDSSVDTSVVGTYIVTYTTDDAAGNLVTATRTVLVEDTTAPEVALNGLAAITLEAGVDNYVEQNVSATDTITASSSLTVTIDGNVDTSSVGTYVVTYTVIDLQNNSVQLTRVITVQDTTPPTLELVGSPTITVEAGSNYLDQGAVAIDIVDGIVSVTVDSSVDTSVVGTYIVAYAAEDEAGNVATITRTIHVVSVPKKPGGGVLNWWLLLVLFFVNIAKLKMFQNMKGSATFIRFFRG